MGKREPIVISLGDNDIEAIANGQNVTAHLPNGDEIIIVQNMGKDIAQPIVERDRKIFNKAEIEKRRLTAIIANDLFQSIGN